MPPQPTAQAARTFPARMSDSISLQRASVASLSKGSAPARARRLPARLNSGETTSVTFPAVTAKETSVGGTSSFSKLPDMESLPPIAPAPKAICASSAPSRAAKGLPQRSGAVRSRSKYSWKLR